MTGFLAITLLARNQVHGEIISFALVRTKSKRLTISVYPDLAVKVKAPNGKSLDQIKARVEHRAAWISKQLQHFRQSPLLLPNDDCKR